MFVRSMNAPNMRFLRFSNSIQIRSPLELRSLSNSSKRGSNLKLNFELPISAFGLGCARGCEVA
jgi:hypothetical protein